MKPYNISHMIMSIGNHKKNYVMKINVVSIFYCFAGIDFVRQQFYIKKK